MIIARETIGRVAVPYRVRAEQMNDAVIYQCEGRVAQLNLNRPNKSNCINLAVLDGLIAGIEEAEQAEGVRAVLLTAEGEHFCTGADLDEVRAHSRSRESLDLFISRGHTAMRRLESSPLPIIAAV